MDPDSFFSFVAWPGDRPKPAGEVEQPGPSLVYAKDIVVGEGDKEEKVMKEGQNMTQQGKKKKILSQR